jgi:hypothetical protein
VVDGPDIVVPDEEASDVTVAGEDASGPPADAEAAHELNRRVRRNLLLLSLANWGIAVVAWSLSAYLGVTSPASLMVYTILFLIGLFAAIVAIAAYVLEKFAHRPEPSAPDASAAEEPGVAATPSA